MYKNIKIEHSKNNRLWGIVLVSLILIFGPVMSYFYKTSMIQIGLVFSLFLLLGMLLPGLAITLLLNINIKNEIELVTYSLFMGYLVTFLEYFIAVPTGLKNFALSISIITSIASLVYVLYRLNGKEGIVIGRDALGRWICLVFLLVTIIISFFTYAGTNLLPPAIPENNLYKDCLYWIGNTIELTKEFPPINFRHYPLKYNYHYFSSIQLAFTSLVTGIKPPLLSFGYSYIIPVAMIVLGAYCLFSRLTDKAIIKVMAIFTLLYTAGDQTVSIVTYTHHIFIGPFGFDYGLGCFLFLLYLVTKEYQNKKSTVVDCFVMFAMFALTCGIKANFGAIALVGIGLVCAKWLLIDRNWKRAFGIGIPILLMFALVYFGVTNIRGYSGGVVTQISNSRVFEIEIFKITEIYNKIKSYPIPGFLSEVIFFFVYNMICHPVIFGIMLYQIIRDFIKRKRVKLSSIILLVLIFICCWINLYLGMHGMSQAYFMMTAYPLGIMFILINMEYSEGRGKGVKCISILLLLAFGFYGWGMKLFDGSTIFDIIGIGANNYFVQNIDYDATDRGYMSDKLMEGYDWLSEEAGERDIVVANDERYTVGVFTECYLCNDEDSMIFFSTDDVMTQTESVEKMKDKNVKWIIYVKNPEVLWKVNTNKCDLAFDNEEVSIYKIL